MNKIPAKLIAAALVILALIAAGIVALRGGGSVSPASLDTPVKPSQQQDVRQLRLGMNIAAGSALHAAAIRFAEQVEERSKGKLKVMIFPDQQLGSDDQMIEMARNGTLDLLLTPTAKLSAAIPAMQYADLPFYFSGRDELYAMLDGAPGQMLLAKMAAIDLVGITFWENGFKQFTANTQLRTPKDFGKLRIRTMKSPLIADQFATLGAQPIPIDFHATYKALADGAVDGQENPLVAIVGMRFHEVQKHMTLSNHAYLGYAFSASKRVFETLSPDQRDLIQNVARELTLWERTETARREVELIEKIRAVGVTITTLTADERLAFSKALAPIADKFGFEVGYDLLAKTEELRYARQKFPAGKEPLIIGVDADLSSRNAQAGGAILRGIQLAVEDINRKGGLLGQPLRVIARDHATIPQAGRKNLEVFAAMPSLIAVVGGMNTPVIDQELDDIHRLQVPYLIPWAAGEGLINHKFKPSYTFRVSISDSQVGPFLLDKALSGGGKVTVLLERTVWGRSNEAVLKPLIDKLPAGRVIMEWLEPGEAGLAARIGTMTQNGSRAMLLVANSHESHLVVKAMADTQKPLPIYAHWALTGADFWGQNRAYLSKVDLRFAQSVLVNNANPRVTSLIKRYRERFGLDGDTPVPSPIGTVHAYDLTNLLARAVVIAGSTDRTLIRKAMESIPAHSGILREYKQPFTPARHEALEQFALHLARYDDRGRIVAAE